MRQAIIGWPVGHIKKTHIGSDNCLFLGIIRFHCDNIRDTSLTVIAALVCLDGESDERIKKRERN